MLSITTGSWLDSNPHTRSSADQITSEPLGQLESPGHKVVLEEYTHERPPERTGLPAKRRWRPSRRDRAREEGILNAALELVAEIGYDRITVNQIAARARASKATIYSRWPGKAELVAGAVRRRAEAPSSVVKDTGSLRGDLLATVKRLVRSITGDGSPSLLGLLEAVRDDRELRVLIAGQIQRASAEAGEIICARAVTRGELSVPVNDAAAILRLAIADLLLQTLLAGAAPGPAAQQQLTDDVLLPLLTRLPGGSARTP